ncbi:MAG TPA: (5-formylfuran-3-yl)methyl phosphate synthase [Gemmataceae bacterium]|nr:(5-formylfuran-3-yl)methyl phosphate synthase [Gemmataceae bacterium]
MHALSLKQPWAALLVHGLKTIEVRRWPTARRERILIHAARVPDERPEAWNLVPSHLHEAAQLRGGIVGAGDLIGCKRYANRETFAADQAAHLNKPSWFDGPVLYGFTFANLTVLPFRPCPGWMRFFPVDEPNAESFGSRQDKHPGNKEVQGRRSGLLVSVRSVAEAEAALAGGAALIDIKEPRRGSLGPASYKTIRAIIDQVAGRRPVSAALGELLETNLPLARIPLAYAKWGLAGCAQCPDWPARWHAAAERLRQVAPGCRPVLVAYADWGRAQAPQPETLFTFALLSHCDTLLLDTWRKDGTTLLDWLSAAAVIRLCRDCRQAGIRVALAGSLGRSQILELRAAEPDWFAVRGAVCHGGRRDAAIDPEAVRRLADLVAGLPITAASPGSSPPPPTG